MICVSHPTNINILLFANGAGILFDTAVAAGLGPVKEGRFLLPGADRRPADVFLPNWAGGQDAALDVTVVSPLQDATVAGAAATAGHAFAYERS